MSSFAPLTTHPLRSCPHFTRRRRLQSYHRTVLLNKLICVILLTCDVDSLIDAVVMLDDGRSSSRSVWIHYLCSEARLSYICVAAFHDLLLLGRLL